MPTSKQVLLEPSEETDNEELIGGNGEAFGECHTLLSLEPTICNAILFLPRTSLDSRSSSFQNLTGKQKYPLGATQS